MALTITMPRLNLSDKALNAHLVSLVAKGMWGRRRRYVLKNPHYRVDDIVKALRLDLHRLSGEEAAARLKNDLAKKGKLHHDE